MKIIPLLKKEIKKSIILEFSDKLIQKLIKRFKNETKDDTDTILSYISDFEKYKEGFDPEDRNIEKLSYNNLKNLVEPKRLKSNIAKYLKHFKKTTKRVSNTDIVKTIRKFLELEKYLDPKDRNIIKFEYLELVGFLEKNFEKLMSKILRDKLSKETQLNQDQISYYITTYFNIFNEIPLDSRLVTDMYGDEFEHFIDGLSGTSERLSTSEDIKNIELLYDKNNLKIFEPKTKDQCILLRNGRSWCTSRDGSGNLYYNYRLNNNLTLYYVINEDLPYSHTDFASVILVQPNGSVRLADGTNSGRFSGHDTVSWNLIYEKIPKLKGLEKIFVPKPLSKEELETIRKVQNTSVGNNPIESFNGDEKMVELWLEIKSPKLSDSQYANITDDLKKKYIALGFSLSPIMMKNSSNKVMEYYISKKIESIKTKSLDQFNEDDIALLRTPLLSKLRESLIEKFIPLLTNNGEKLEIDGFDRGTIGKFVGIYGFKDFMKYIPDTITNISIIIPQDSNIKENIDLTDLGRLKNLNMIYFENCISEVSESLCNLKELTFIGFPNNPNLKTLPECLADLPKIKFINCKGSNNLELSSYFSQRGMVLGNNMVDFFSKRKKNIE